jgi:hypothetical protein
MQLREWTELFSLKISEAVWRVKPTWYLIMTNDNCTEASNIGVNFKANALKCYTDQLEPFISSLSS